MKSYSEFNRETESKFKSDMDEILSSLAETVKGTTDSSQAYVAIMGSLFILSDRRLAAYHSWLSEQLDSSRSQTDE